MTSKEALELLELILLNHSSMLVINDKRFEYFNIIKERLEELEKENKKWREIVGCDLCEALGREILLEENEKLKKALKMACERLSWDCPCSQDLIDDLDCENRCQPDIDYAECWKKYFLKEVVNNESNNT